jgi:subtilisin family serine protease
MVCDAGSIRFSVRTQLSSGRAYLRFYIDPDADYPISVAKWTNYMDWTRREYQVSAGYHAFVWSWELGGAAFPTDNAWLDDIEFPVANGGELSASAIAANNATAAGIAVLAASGNEGLCRAIATPACIGNVISVGAVYDAAIEDVTRDIYEEGCLSRPVTTTLCDCDGQVQFPGIPTWECTDREILADTVPCWSNTSACLDLLAPSMEASTLDVSGSAGYREGDYFNRFGGTSASCAYATGAVACLQSASKEILGRYLTAAEVYDILTSTGNPVYDPKADLSIPRINLDKAIEKVKGMLQQP